MNRIIVENQMNKSQGMANSSSFFIPFEASPHQLEKNAGSGYCLPLGMNSMHGRAAPSLWADYWAPLDLSVLFCPPLIQSDYGQKKHRHRHS